MKITLEDVDDLARGAALLGTGGGGDPYVGSLMLRQAIEDFGPVELIDVEDTGDDDLLVPTAMMGAPTVLIEKIPNGDEVDLALEAIQAERGGKASAILCAEIGGVNALMPMILAARKRLPVVDGDGMGRAFPQLQMVTYHIFGVPAAPCVMTDEYGNAVVIRAANTHQVEMLGRHLVVGMGGSAMISLYSMRGREAKRSIVRGTLSLALGLGRAIRQARVESGEPIARLLEFLRGTEYYEHSYAIFNGKIVDILRETRAGWAIGRLMVEGRGRCAGRKLEIEFQNEFLIAREGKRVRCVVPDLIAVLDESTAEPITTEALKYGQRVAVLGMSAAPVMRSDAALAVFGPQAFGFDHPFVRIEELERV